MPRIIILNIYIHHVIKNLLISKTCIIYYSLSKKKVSIIYPSTNIKIHTSCYLLKNLHLNNTIISLFDEMKIS